MSFPVLTAAPAPAPTLPSGVDLSLELSALADEIKRTRDWYNTQVDAQLASLRHLRTAVHHAKTGGAPTHAGLSTLFEAPHPVVDLDASSSGMDAPTPLAVALAHAFAPVDSCFNPAAQGFTPALNQAVVLPPTHVTALDPELEQATLRELNDALAKAFSEISARGGMLT